MAFERVASINPSRITDQGSKKRVQPHVINIICLASDSAPDGTFVRNERLTSRVRYVRLLAQAITVVTKASVNRLFDSHKFDCSVNLLRAFISAEKLNSLSRHARGSHPRI